VQRHSGPGQPAVVGVGIELPHHGLGRIVLILAEQAQRVAFGTSGHRGSANRRSFNEAHIAATTQADLSSGAARRATPARIVLGRDTHALSTPAICARALEVLAGNGGRRPPADERRADRHAGRLARDPAPEPRPRRRPRRRDRRHAVAQPARGRRLQVQPARTAARPTATSRAWIEKRANELIAGGLEGREAHDAARRRMAAPTTRRADLIGDYVDDLRNAIDVDAIAKAGVRIGVDPLGRRGPRAWGEIADRHRPRRHDRQRGSSTRPSASCASTGTARSAWTARRRRPWPPLVALKDRFQVAIGNDADADRHGIVTPSGGLMNPNHFLAVAIDHLLAPAVGEKAASARPACQRDHRPRRRQARPAARRGPGGLQVVRAAA
jgi:phosphoglucomutase